MTWVRCQERLGIKTGIASNTNSESISYKSHGFVVVVGWALPTIIAVALRARETNRLSQTNRNGGQCPPYNPYGSATD